MSWIFQNIIECAGLFLNITSAISNMDLTGFVERTAIRTSLVNLRWSWSTYNCSS